MAEFTESPKPKKSKDRSDKKKRKHVDEDAAENASPSKKSKTNGHVSNGISSPTPDQLQLAAEINNEHDRRTSVQPQNSVTMDKPRKKRKKSKHAHEDAPNEEANGTLVQDLAKSSPEKRKSKKSKEDLGAQAAILAESPKKKSVKPDGPEDIQNASTTPHLPKKPRHKDKKRQSQAQAIPIEEKHSSPMPMEIDAAPTDTISDQFQDEDPTPYVTRSLRSILSTVTTISPIENTSKSPFCRQAIQLYLPLSPITLPLPLEGLCAEHLSPLLLRYYAPLHGVVLSYAHPRFSSESTSDGTPLAISVAEYSTPMIWIDVDFLLFKPERGHEVEGMIVLQSESYIGVQVYNLFSGRIPKNRLPNTWAWMDSNARGKGKSRKGKLKDADSRTNDALEEPIEEETGYWANEEGEKVKGVIKFFVWDVDMTLGGKEAERNLPTLEGSLLEADFDGTAKKRQAIKAGKRRAREESET